MWLVEVRVRDYGFGETEVDQVWQRWRDGESFGSISRALGKPLQHVRWFVSQTGGIRPPTPRASRASRVELKAAWP